MDLIEKVIRKLAPATPPATAAGIAEQKRLIAEELSGRLNSAGELVQTVRRGLAEAESAKATAVQQIENAGDRNELDSAHEAKFQALAKIRTLTPKFHEAE